MPYNYVKVNLRGAGPSGEVWSVNPVFRATRGLVPDNPTPAQLSAAVTGINALTIPTDIRNLMGSTNTIAGVKLEVRGLASGLQAVIEGNRTTAVAGASTTTRAPQTSIVVSLRTLTPGGRGRGRLYWPSTGGGFVSATSRLGSGDRDLFATAMRGLLLDIGNAISTAFDGEGMDLAVYSPTNNALSDVTSIQVGDVFDTQRRRRDAIPEAYFTLPYPF